MKSLSACFLTRNEASTIARAVRSVKDVADEVLVADTGSDDGTAEAAAAAGATVVQFTWGDDFAAGRNFVIRQARGDWVLWMQAAEELLPESVAAVRECVAHDQVFGCFVRLENVTDAAKPQAASETADLRLFRRRGDLPQLFVGRLHPHFHPDVLAAVRHEGLQVVQGNVVLRNYVDATPPSPAKLRFNARLLEAELNDRPGQLHYLIEYGRTLLMMRDERGHEVMAQAAEQVAAARDLPSSPIAKVQVLLNYLLTIPPAKSKSRLTFDDARDLAERWFPGSPSVLWTLAEQAFHRRDYAAAAQHLRRLLDLGRSGAYDRTHRFDARVLGAHSLLNLGACYLQMRKLDEAEACFVQLTAHPEYGSKASQMLAIAQKWRQSSR